MRIYLDLCVFNRPFDYQGQDRVELETGIFIFLLEQIESGRYALVASDALVFENSRNPDAQRKERIANYLQVAGEFILTDETDIDRAKTIRGYGFSDFDAMHIALAEKAKVEYFITCDDDIIRRCKKNEVLLSVRVISLTEFVGLEVK